MIVNVLDELIRADKVINNALKVMSKEQIASWAKLNTDQGLSTNEDVASSSCIRQLIIEHTREK